MIARVLAVAVAAGLAGATTPAVASAGEGAGAVQLRMRAAPSDAPDDEAEGPRTYRGPTMIRDEPGRTTTWVAPPSAPSESADPSPPDASPTSADPASDNVTPSIPSPSTVRGIPEHISVGVGLAPQAPGSKDERALLDALEASAIASADPTTDVRRLRAGAGEPRRACRSRRYDLVVMVGYVADRPDAVVLAHDCRLDRALSVRAGEAVHQPGLIHVLWQEHVDLQRTGLRERRRVALSPVARGGIIGGVATVVVGVAVGVLVANALREDRVVITVRP